MLALVGVQLTAPNEQMLYPTFSVEGCLSSTFCIELIVLINSPVQIAFLIDLNSNVGIMEFMTGCPKYANQLPKVCQVEGGLVTNS